MNDAYDKRGRSPRRVVSSIRDFTGTDSAPFLIQVQRGRPSVRNVWSWLAVNFSL